jgi:hypothetical protein
MATAGTTVRLAPGLLSIYGRGSIYGFTGQSKGLTFGVINSMSQNISGSYALGQNVLFPYLGANSVFYDGTEYWLIDESKIILVEIPPDAPILS